MVAAVSRGTTSLPLDQLVQMGFERGAAAATLVACANDVAQAATLLSEAAEMARIKREEHLRRDKTWRKRGQYEAKLAGLDHKGPQHVAALALTDQQSLWHCWRRRPSTVCGTLLNLLMKSTIACTRLMSGSSGGKGWPCRRQTTPLRMSLLQRRPWRLSYEILID